MANATAFETNFSTPSEPYFRLTAILLLGLGDGFPKILISVYFELIAFSNQKKTVCEFEE